MQMGYRTVEWVKGHPAVDLVAELPKKDPDGFEYRELWVVSMGRNAPPEMLMQDLAMGPPDRFLRSVLRRTSLRLEARSSREGTDLPITVLVILLKNGNASFEIERMRMMVESRRKEEPRSSSVRVRIWDRQHLTSLVQQFPQIGYKYFSDEALTGSKFRKTSEELYEENVQLNDRLAFTVNALEDERNRRVRAERDAIWKDISFAAAHKLGNPIFAIETFLAPLQKRVAENRREETEQVIAGISASVEKAKDIIDQFKSLSRAQELSIIPTLLRPILEDVCTASRQRGIDCLIECPSEIRILADPNRIAECFDELATNSTHWFDKEKRIIRIQALAPASKPLPESLDSTREYVLVKFQDNGAGIMSQDKEAIFDAFVTKREQGTGLGLALVRRIVEGHSGLIFECGVPGEGADFELFLPLDQPDEVREADQAATSAGGDRYESSQDTDS